MGLEIPLERTRPVDRIVPGGDDLFLRGLVNRLGAKVGVVTYDRRAREAGESKYTLRKMLKLALKGMECGRCRPKSVPRGADPWIAEALHE